MDKRPDIWFHLRDHQTPPPPELQRRVRESLFDNSVLERLQQEEATPPDFLRTAITGTIRKSMTERSGVTGKVQQLFRRRLIYGSIAASLLLLLTGTAIYKTITRKAPAPKDNVTVKNVPVASAQTADSLKSADTSRTAIAVSSEDLPAAETDSATSAIVKHDRIGSLHLDGHSMRLVDNDPLFTFTSYRYPEIGNYLEKVGEEIKITVDQYTNIVISQQAALMIREMYKTRSNGKPTRRARKMKERLEYWKKADEKRFDGALRLNPADPIDLAEFIFK
ncbi:MAG TPA: hypothetical protein VL727_28790 [Puia sp.]|jgi:hypothetical protein|nr:hypothetical protein [Puia sp.]